MEAGMDDDMQAAIRMSLEEEQRRLDAIQGAQGDNLPTDTTQATAMQTEPANQ